MRVAVCDDEKQMLDIIYDRVLTLYSREAEDVRVDSFSLGSDLEKSHRKQNYDIIFLDIDMPHISGLETAELIRGYDKNVLLVFVSNMDDYVYQSFKVQPYRFIRKSRLEDLEEAVKSSVKTILRDNYIVKLETDTGVVSFKISKITAFTCIGHSVFLCTDKTKTRVRATMKKLEKELEALGFVRTHNSFIVNCGHIKFISGDSVILDDSSSVPVSRRQLKLVKERFLRYCGE